MSSLLCLLHSISSNLFYFLKPSSGLEGFFFYLGILFYPTALFPLQAAPDSPLAQEASASLRPVTKPKAELSIFIYNLQNFLLKENHPDSSAQSKPIPTKSPESLNALYRIIKEAQPDLLGVCEMGSQKDLNSFLKSLQKNGLHYPHSTLIKGSDSLRHLAFISRYPFFAVHQPKTLHYEIGGKTRTMRRGLLHVELRTHGHHLHFIGAHLKSKRPTKEAPQELIRLHEARLLRSYVSKLLKADPIPKLIVYGDLNDHPNSPALRKIKGYAPKNLIPFYPCDEREHYWTHFWHTQRSYSVFDYILLSPSLWPYLQQKRSFIFDHPLWNQASDHRPLLIRLKNSS